MHALLRVTLSIGLLSSCGRDEAPHAPPTPTVVDPAADARAAKGKQVVGTLKKQLVGALTEAMTTGVPAAIGVCNTTAPAIAQALAVDGVTVGRATRKPRNPANAAADWQLEAIASFEEMVRRGDKLEGQRFVRHLPDGRTRYAEPLVIQPLCVSCHGAALAPDVSAALAAAYPNDQATGYAVGDLRGVAWAEVAATK